MKVFIIFGALVTLAVAASLPEYQNSSIIAFKDLKDIDTRIINGDLAGDGQYPWMAAVYSEKGSVTNFCGGALIQQRWVLTAAQCVKDVSKFKIVLGSTKSGLTSDPKAVVVDATEGIVHENYNQKNFNHDIALIKLPSDVGLTDKIKTIALPDKNDNTGSNVDVTVIGWGQAGTIPVISSSLRYAKMKTISNDDCKNSFNGDIVISETLCAKNIGGKNPCGGDGGSPLIITKSNGDVVQTGIMSFLSTQGCTSPLPIGSVRTANYREWIDKHTNGAKRLESVYAITLIVTLLLNKTIF